MGIRAGSHWQPGVGLLAKLPRIAGAGTRAGEKIAAAPSGREGPSQVSSSRVANGLLQELRSVHERDLEEAGRGQARAGRACSEQPERVIDRAKRARLQEPDLHNEKRTKSSRTDARDEVVARTTEEGRTDRPTRTTLVAPSDGWTRASVRGDSHRSANDNANECARECREREREKERERKRGRGERGREKENISYIADGAFSFEIPDTIERSLRDFARAAFTRRGIDARGRPRFDHRRRTERGPRELGRSVQRLERGPVAHISTTRLHPGAAFPARFLNSRARRS